MIWVAEQSVNDCAWWADGQLDLILKSGCLVDRLLEYNAETADGGLFS